MNFTLLFYPSTGVLLCVLYLILFTKNTNFSRNFLIFSFTTISALLINMLTFKSPLINDITHVLYIALVHSTIFITFENKSIHALIFAIVIMNLVVSVLNGFKCPYEEATYVCYPESETVVYGALTLSLVVNLYKSELWKYIYDIYRKQLLWETKAPLETPKNGDIPSTLE